MPKSKPTPPPPEEVAVPPAAEPAILQRLETPSKWNMVLVAGGLVLAAGLGVFAMRGAMKKPGKDG